MNINIHNIQSLHWIELFRQMKAPPWLEIDKLAESQIDFYQWWQTSKRADQLLFYAAYEGTFSRKQIVKVTCLIARATLHLIPAEEKRPLIALETTERWLQDQATLKEVRNAAYAAADAAVYATYAANAVYAAAINAAGVDAAYAAADAAYAAAYAANAVYAAAADAAAVDAADAAINAAGVNNNLSDLVRDNLPLPTKLIKEWERIVRLKAFW